MSSNGGRRKLHARRAEAGQFAAQHDKHDAEFTWASDRGTLQNNTQHEHQRQAPAASSQSVQSVHSRVTSRNTAACQRRTPGTNEATGFRWISAYLSEDAEIDERSEQYSQKASMQQPQTSMPGAREQQKQATSQHTRLTASSLAAAAAAGANKAAAGAGAAASLAATAAGTAGAAARSAASAAVSWFDGKAGSWLDRLLGYDAQLEQNTVATAVAVSQAAVTSQPSRQAATAPTAPAQQLHRRLPWQSAAVRQQPAPPQHPQTTATSVQGSTCQHEHRQSSRASAITQQQQQQQQQQHVNQHSLAVVGGPLGYLFLAAASAALTVREVADAAVATYTDTLKPAAQVLWQFAAAVSGLVGVLVMYFLLPLLKVVTVALQQLLLATSKLLNSYNQQLKGLLAPRTAATATGTAAAAAAAAAGVTAAAGAASTTAVVAADAAADVAAGRTTAAGTNGSTGVNAQHTVAASNQQLLLQSAAKQLVEVCRSRPNLITNFPINVWRKTNYFAWPYAPDAGYGPSAFHGSYYDTRTCCCTAVAIQVQILDGPEQIMAWCDSVRVLKDLQHPYVMPLLGASVGIVPRVKVCPATAAAALAGSAAASTTKALVGCLLFQQLEHPRDFMSALRHPDAVHQCSRFNRAPAGASSIGATAAAAAAAAAADNTATAEEELRLATWTDRLQLGPQLVSGLHYLCMQSAKQTELVHEAAVHLQQAATTTALSQGAAAIVDRVRQAGSAQLLLELVQLHNWVGNVSMQQLAGAVVVETSAERFDLKINPSLLLLQQQECRTDTSSRSGRRTAMKAAANSSSAVLPALGELLLMLVTAGTNSTGASWLEPECSRIDLARELLHFSSPSMHNPTMLLPEAERAGADDDRAASILKGMAYGASGLLAWELPPEMLQLRQQQRRQGQQWPSGRASYAAAAAEAGSSRQQQQQEAQQATQPAGRSAAAGGVGHGGNHLSGTVRSFLPPAAASSSAECFDSSSSSVQARMHTFTVPVDTVHAANLAVARAEAVLGFNWGALLELQEMLAHASSLCAPVQAWELEDEGGQGAVSDMASTEEEEEDLDVNEQLEASQQHQQQQQQPELASLLAHGVSTTSSPDQPPPYFICPITSAVMTDPVVAADGYTYERSAIVRWLQVSRLCMSPMTNQCMDPTLVPNHSLRSSIMEWRLQHQ